MSLNMSLKSRNHIITEAIKSKVAEGWIGTTMNPDYPTEFPYMDWVLNLGSGTTTIDPKPLGGYYEFNQDFHIRCRRPNDLEADFINPNAALHNRGSENIPIAALQGELEPAILIRYLNDNDEGSGANTFRWELYGDAHFEKDEQVRSVNQNSEQIGYCTTRPDSWYPLLGFPTYRDRYIGNFYARGTLNPNGDNQQCEGSIVDKWFKKSPKWRVDKRVIFSPDEQDQVIGVFDPIVLTAYAQHLPSAYGSASDTRRKASYPDTPGWNNIQKLHYVGYGEPVRARLILLFNEGPAIDIRKTISEEYGGTLSPDLQELVNDDWKEIYNEIIESRVDGNDIPWGIFDINLTYNLVFDLQYSNWPPGQYLISIRDVDNDERIFLYQEIFEHNQAGGSDWREINIRARENIYGDPGLRDMELLPYEVTPREGTFDPRYPDSVTFEIDPIREIGSMNQYGNRSNYESNVEVPNKRDKKTVIGR